MWTITYNASVFIFKVVESVHAFAGVIFIVSCLASYSFPVVSSLPLLEQLRNN